MPVEGDAQPPAISCALSRSYRSPDREIVEHDLGRKIGPAETHHAVGSLAGEITTIDGATRCWSTTTPPGVPAVVGPSLDRYECPVALAEPARKGGEQPIDGVPEFRSAVVGSPTEGDRHPDVSTVRFTFVEERHTRQGERAHEGRPVFRTVEDRRGPRLVVVSTNRRSRFRRGSARDVGSNSPAGAR